MVSDFINHLCDNQAYLHDMKTTNKENGHKDVKKVISCSEQLDIFCQVYDAN